MKKDKQVLRFIKFSGVSSDHVRVDANNIWNDEKQCIKYLNEISDLIWGIEEPLTKRDISKFLEINRKTGKKIILDESFLKIEDFDEIKKYPESFLVNLRVSKMGCVLWSINIIKKFQEYNFKFILGSHVGETSLLSRAALLLGENYKDHIYAMEGAYSSHLLNLDPVRPEIKFEKKGVVKVEELDLKNVGWGIDFNE